MIDPHGSEVATGRPVSGTLGKHTADTFRISLGQNALIFGNVDQVTVDVVVKILGTDQSELASFDSPARGPEPFHFESSEAGIYSIVVLPFEEEEGNYILNLEGADPVAKTKEGKIDQLVRLAMANAGNGPGAALAVVKDGKVIYSKGYGYANLEYGVENTPSTIFHIASVSKQFTAFAIAMLADQGKISLQDDIRKYLPEMPDFGHVITIDHLVHHTSGLRDQWNLLALAGWRLDDVITREQVLRLISRQQELNFKPGEEMLYCNTGFTLMAEIVSRASGQPFPEWCKANIFDPLEMKNTLFYDDHEKVVPGRAYSYYKDGVTGEWKKSVLSYANVGATSLFTTVEDLGRWAVNFENVKVGNERIMQLMDQRFVLNNGDTIDYAFGQGIGKYKGLVNKSHGGADAGYRTFLARFPEQRFSVIVFSNLASFNTGSLAYKIADLYLADQYTQEPDAPAQSSNDTPEPPFDPSTVGLAEYAGSYYSPELETTYTLEVVNDTLTAHHQRHDDIRLHVRASDDFSTTAWWTGRIKFTRDGAGKIDGFRVNAGRVRNLKFTRTDSK